MSRYTASITLRVEFSADNGHSADVIAKGLAYDALKALTDALEDGETADLDSFKAVRS
jgi:hypothetical protein